ncbi:MAG: hypothetical protein E7Z89_00520 [Cyanobacteria bacterium SIG28]|nr:hypothetical protein [Cyanobacteria bacterium SIG28]
MTVNGASNTESVNQTSGSWGYANYTPPVKGDDEEIKKPLFQVNPNKININSLGQGASIW